MPTTNQPTTKATDKVSLYPYGAVLSKHYDAHIQAQAWHVLQKRGIVL